MSWMRRWDCQRWGVGAYIDKQVAIKRFGASMRIPLPKKPVRRMMVRFPQKLHERLVDMATNDAVSLNAKIIECCQAVSKRDAKRDAKEARAA